MKETSLCLGRKKSLFSLIKCLSRKFRRGARRQHTQKGPQSRVRGSGAACEVGSWMGNPDGVTLRRILAPDWVTGDTTGVPATFTLSQDTGPRALSQRGGQGTKPPALPGPSPSAPSPPGRRRRRTRCRWRGRSRSRGTAPGACPPPAPPPGSRSRPGSPPCAPRVPWCQEGGSGASLGVWGVGQR